jgi:hypothetical protein
MERAVDEAERLGIDAQDGDDYEDDSDEGSSGDADQGVGAVDGGEDSDVELGSTSQQVGKSRCTTLFHTFKVKLELVECKCRCAASLGVSKCSSDDRSAAQ